MILVTVEKENPKLSPQEIFERFNSKGKFILETAEGEERNWRYSYLSETAECYIKNQGNKNFILNRDFTVREEFKGDFFSLSKKFLSKRVINSKFPFIGGLVGYYSYDQSKSYEKKLFSRNKDFINTADGYFGYYKRFIVFDHRLNKLFIVELIEDESLIDSKKRELNLYYDELLKREINKSDREEKAFSKEFKSNYKEEEFISMVEKAKDYIEEGDIFQVVLSQQLEKEINIPAIEVYKRLKVINPSPYMYYLEFEDFEIVGSSPEILISLNNGIARTNPIAGTIKRGDENDEVLINRLKNDEKERAEHMMLLDLGRNDLGKVSEFASVKVEEFMKAEIFSHVIHLSSKVIGVVKEGFDAIELLKSAMPAGTVSGAPKHRAMEIIEELENRKRGIYSGAVGYLSLNGNMDMAIAIRTIVIKNNKAYLQAGAGVVYDSIPKKEYEETLNKLGALMEVLK